MQLTITPRGGSPITTDGGDYSRADIERVAAATFPGQFIQVGMYQRTLTIWEGATVILSAVVAEGGSTGGRVLATIRGSY